MTTDADAGAYRRLAEALSNRRGDEDAYRRLGEQMTARRHLLDPRYGNRRLFVRERLLPLGLKESAAYKLVYDLEAGKLQGRASFSPGNMLVLAGAYGVTPDEIIAVLAGGAFADPGPGHPPAVPAPPPAGDGGWMPDLEPGTLARARPIADAIFMARSDWRAAWAAGHPGTEVSQIPEPPGAELFPGDDEDARTWDRRAGIMSVPERVWLIAGFRAREAGARQREAGTG